jgi:hypothetical protein
VYCAETLAAVYAEVEAVAKTMSDMQQSREAAPFSSNSIPIRMRFWRAWLPILFPSADPIASFLTSFAALAVGFLFRPLGAIVLGKIGDKFGRKTAFIVADVGKHPRHMAESVLS